MKRLPYTGSPEGGDEIILVDDFVIVSWGADYGSGMNVYKDDNNCAEEALSGYERSYDAIVWIKQNLELIG